MTHLHITNGDGAADVIKQSAVPGDVLPWRDPMHHGPVPAGGDLEELSRIRARYLAGPEGSIADIERDFRLRDAHLRAAPQYMGVVLWFEHDLLDQLQILQLLDWFGKADLGDTTLEIICIDAFPGIDVFRGIGQLTPGQMASLFDQRRPVRQDMTALATRGWAAFRSDDPRDLLAFLEGDLACMPFLEAALRRHLEEYPSISNGLSRTENQLLSLVAEGVDGPVELFLANMDLETALFMGDWTTFSTLDVLCGAGLLACDPHPFRHPSNAELGRAAFREQRFRVTQDGHRVLAGELDAAALLQRDAWLGGVHLRPGGAMWRWDDTTASLSTTEP